MWHDPGVMRNGIDWNRGTRTPAATWNEGFSDLSADAGDLTLKGDYWGAAANMLLNIATAVVALLARFKAAKMFIS